VNEEGKFLSEPSFAFLLRIVERRKRGRRKELCMQTLMFLSFACLQEFLFPERSKKEKKRARKKQHESSSLCRLFLLMLDAGGV
jgi:hypothetical protein